MSLPWRHFFGKGEKLRQMFPLFRQELEQAMTQQPQDDKALANWVHRQAGTISMMMVPQLAEEAWRLEEDPSAWGAGLYERTGPGFAPGCSTLSGSCGS